MKRVWVAITMLGLVALPGWAAAHQGMEDEEKVGSEQTITGEVVDLACYLSEGASGPSHKDCAQKCIASGLPVGIKSGDEIYVAIGSEHGPANAALAPLAAQEVTAEGTVTERNGVHLIAIKKVTLKGA